MTQWEVFTTLQALGSVLSAITPPHPKKALVSYGA